MNQEMVNRSVGVLLIQHTGAKKDDVLYIGNSPVTFFIRGSTLDNNHIHGGLEIALSRKAYIVWVEAVKEEAVKSVIIVVTTRYMSTDMDWAYGRKRTMNPAHRRKEG